MKHNVAVLADCKHAQVSDTHTYELYSTPIKALICNMFDKSVFLENGQLFFHEDLRALGVIRVDCIDFPVEHSSVQLNTQL